MPVSLPLRFLVMPMQKKLTVVPTSLRAYILKL